MRDTQKIRENKRKSKEEKSESIRAHAEMYIESVGEQSRWWWLPTPQRPSPSPPQQQRAQQQQVQQRCVFPPIRRARALPLRPLTEPSLRQAAGLATKLVYSQTRVMSIYLIMRETRKYITLLLFLIPLHPTPVYSHSLIAVCCWKNKEREKEERKRERKECDKCQPYYINFLRFVLVVKLHFESADGHCNFTKEIKKCLERRRRT